MAHDGACVRCVGPLAFVNEDDGVCSCQEGFVLSPEFTCIACPTGIFIGDTAVCDFTVAGGIYINGILTCKLV